MEVDVAYYDRLQPGHIDRNYAHLHRCFNAIIERDCLARRRNETLRSIAGEHGAALGAVIGVKGETIEKKDKPGEKGQR